MGVSKTPKAVCQWKNIKILLYQCWGQYLGVKTCEFFLSLGVIVCALYIVSGLFVVLLVLCFTSLVSFTGFYTEDEPNVDCSFESNVSTQVT